MSDWFHNLPVLWMCLLIFGGTYLGAAIICGILLALAKGERKAAFRAVSPGFLSPMGMIFGLFVVFTAVQVWNDNDRANAAVDREASSLKAVVVLAMSFPEESQERLRSLIARHIEEAVTQEWPMLARRDAMLNMTPPHLAEALQFTLGLTPSTPGQQIAQREMAGEIEAALDARRQRILISRAQVSPLKWTCLLIEAACVLFAIGLVHCENRKTAGITIEIFSTGLAACLLLIACYDRPFTGQLGIQPDSLRQVLPSASLGSQQNHF